MITFYTNQNEKQNCIIQGKDCGVSYNGVFFPGWNDAQIFFEKEVKPILDACGVEIINFENDNPASEKTTKKYWRNRIVTERYFCGDWSFIQFRNHKTRWVKRNQIIER